MHFVLEEKRRRGRPLSCTQAAAVLNQFLKQPFMWAETAVDQHFLLRFPTYIPLSTLHRMWRLARDVVLDPALADLPAESVCAGLECMVNATQFQAAVDVYRTLTERSAVSGSKAVFSAAALAPITVAVSALGCSVLDLAADVFTPMGFPYSR